MSNAGIRAAWLDSLKSLVRNIEEGNISTVGVTGTLPVNESGPWSVTYEFKGLPEIYDEEANG